MRQSFFVPPLGIEPGPSEPESEILSFKLQGHPGKGTANLTKIWGLQAKFPNFLIRRLKPADHQEFVAAVGKRLKSGFPVHSKGIIRFLDGEGHLPIPFVSK